MVIQTAIGGEPITTTIEGRERYTVNVRYAREERDSLEALQRVLVPTMSGAQVPLAQIADIRMASGPSMIRDENGMLAGYVYVDLTGRDVGGYVEEAKKLVAQKVTLPTGYALQWSGQYENMMRVRERLQDRRADHHLPDLRSAVHEHQVRREGDDRHARGAVLRRRRGVAAVSPRLQHLDRRVGGHDRPHGPRRGDRACSCCCFSTSPTTTRSDREGCEPRRISHEAIIHGAVKRIRPKMMTVSAAMMGLMPIMWSLGTGADMMKRVVAPMIGGLVTSFIMELLVYPPIYEFWKWNFEMKRGTVDVSTLPVPELRAH